MFKKVLSAVIGMFAVGAATAASAAAVVIPATAETDILSSVNGGGDIAIKVVLAIVAFVILLRMFKKI